MRATCAVCKTIPTASISPSTTKTTTASPTCAAHLRLQFYPDQTFVKLHHRLEVISPALAPAQGGDLPADCSADMRENIVGDSGEESTLLKLRSFSLHIPFAGIKSGAAWRRRMARRRLGREDLGAAPRS